MLNMIATTKQRAEADAASREFLSLALYNALAKGSPSWAAQMVRAEGDTRRLERIFERAVAGRIGVDDDSPAGGAHVLGDYAQLESGFAATLRRDGVYDRMAGDMIPGAIRQRFAVSASLAVADEVAEGASKPFFDFSFSGDTMDPFKVAVLIAITKDLAKIGGPRALKLLDMQLRRGLTAGVDQKMLADLVALTTPIASTSDLLNDLSALLAALDYGSDARLYFIVETSALAQLTTTAAATGGLAYPSIGVREGSLGNIVILGTDQLAAGVALLVDASQIVTASTPIELDASEHAVVMLDANSPSTLTSLWQKDLVAFLAERAVAIHALRSTALASLSGVNYSGGSPA